METQPAQCPICEARVDVTRFEGGDCERVSCWECGCFTIRREALMRVKALSLEARRARLLAAKTETQAGELPYLSA